ncbi:DUF305 domain-containing protein [Serinibacter salmoneus]|uniref:Uncharacterized protein (DUF305 family) n=1 Tax=Serinibacter salmoneus TaxID=556530 RepID=A0A2A9D340_9MICO|nr:DUF305 domain-containing protein [Serinibacter salmoneus]PFG21073.1 uncharacterized protein (DUF305 family) [Serinibacter salmoneus]
MTVGGATVDTGRRRLLGLSLGAIGMAVTGATLSACAPDEGSSDEPTEVDVGFLTDMSAHHSQALVLCQRVLGGDVGTPVTAAAAEVLQNQAIELGTMRAWLADWGQSTAPPETVMAWMHGGGGMPLAEMHGLASDAELAELSRLDGLEQGRYWLELMSAHHEGGVTMAEAAVDLASSEKVIRLAETQAAVQSFEIEQYRQLLDTTYALKTG